MMQRESFHVRELDCAEEMALLRKEFAARPGIAEIDFDLLNSRMIVLYDPARCTPAQIVQRVAALGMTARRWTEGQRRTDVALNYVRRVRQLGGVEVFAQAQVVNVFNHFQLCGCGGTVAQTGGGVNRATIDQSVRVSGFAAFNPFTTAPVENVNWAYGQNFGKALNRFAYTSPRTFRLSFGVRF